MFIIKRQYYRNQQSSLYLHSCVRHCKMGKTLGNILGMGISHHQYSFLKTQWQFEWMKLFQITLSWSPTGVNSFVVPIYHLYSTYTMYTRCIRQSNNKYPTLVTPMIELFSPKPKMTLNNT